MEAGYNMVVDHDAPSSLFLQGGQSRAILPTVPIPDFFATGSTGSPATSSPAATPSAANPAVAAAASLREACFRRAQEAVAARAASAAATALSIGELTVESLGSVDPRSAYYTQREIWPVGFAGAGTFCLAPGVPERFRCQVLDGGSAPNFKVTFLPDDADLKGGENLGSSLAMHNSGGGSSSSSPAAPSVNSWEGATPAIAWALALAARRLDHSAWHTTSGALAAVAQHALEMGGEDEEEASLLKEVHAALSRKQSLQNALARAAAGNGQASSGSGGGAALAAVLASLLPSDRPTGLVLPSRRAFLGVAAAEAVEALPGALHCAGYLFREERQLRVTAAHRKATSAAAAALCGHRGGPDETGGGGGKGSGKGNRRGAGGGAGGAMREAERLRIRDAELTALADTKQTLKRQRDQEREEKKTLLLEDKEARKKARENDREHAKQMKEEDKVRREKGRDAEKVARQLRKEVADAVRRARAAMVTVV
jgi:hypothetical protein